MEKVQITPTVVKTIESALEERKKGADRRQQTKDEQYAGQERRKGERRSTDA